MTQVILDHLGLTSVQLEKDPLLNEGMMTSRTNCFAIKGIQVLANW